MTLSLIQLQAFAPVCIVAFASLVLLLSDALLMRDANEAREAELGALKGSFLAALTGFFLFCALAVACLNFEFAPHAVSTPQSMLLVDLSASFAMALVCAGALLTIWLSLSYLPVMEQHRGEYYPLTLLSIAGALAVVCAGNLISLFVAIELMSLPVYVLVSFDRERMQSNVAGSAALLSGVFASAFSLYGIAMIYGATGHFDYPGIREAMSADAPLALGGVALLLVGILTRIGAVPFQQWNPSVVVGAPTVVSANIAVTWIGASGFALIRIFDALVPRALPGLSDGASLLAGASMLMGAVLALRETNVKRMFAYAGVAHAGFLLLALTVPSDEARAAALLHVATFLIMQVGVFGAVASIAQPGLRFEALSDYSGLAERRPILAAAMTLFLLSLAGLPGTSGFVSRLLVMSAVIGDGQVGLVILMGIASIVLFAAILRIATAMYMGELSGSRDDTPAEVPTALPSPAPSSTAVIAVGICAVITLYVGLFPGPGPLPFEILEIVKRAATG